MKLMHKQPQVVRANPQTDRTAIMVCSTAGLNLLGTERASLVKIRTALEEAIKQANEADTDYTDFMSKTLLVGNIALATCVAFIEMAGSLGKVAGLKNVDVVAKGLNAGIAFSGSASATLAGQKTDWVATTNAIAKAGSTKIPSKDAKLMAELTTIKVDLLNAAVKNESATVLKVMFLKYVPKLAETSLKMVGKEVQANWVSAATSVASAGASYSTALEKAFNTRLSDKDDMANRKMLKESMQSHMKTVLKRINEIDAIFLSCAMKLA